MINIVDNVVEIINKFKRRAGSCRRWGFGNYRTFDGEVYSLQSDCAYTLVRDVKTNAFHVQARFDRDAVAYVDVYVGDDLYRVKRKNGK